MDRGLRARLEHQVAPAAEDPDATALGWERSYEDQDVRGHRRRARLAAAVRIAGPGPGAVLDVGAGSGRLLAELAGRGWDVSGIEPSVPLADLARLRLPGAADRLLVARAEELPFSDASFDLVTVVAVLEYTDAEAAVRELARVLRPDGRAIVGLRGCRAPTTVWRERVTAPLGRQTRRLARAAPPTPPLRRPLSVERAVSLLRASGLDVEAVQPVGAMILPDPLDRLAPRLAYRTAVRAERSRLLTRAFGTQRLIVARKPRAVPRDEQAGEAE